MNSIALAFLPMGLTVASGLLTGKDANSTGADDAIGQILLAVSPVIPELLDGKKLNENAVLKAMRNIEAVAHSYRVQVGDPTLQPAPEE